MPAPFAPTPRGALYRTIVGCALLVTLGACGYKGPLYMPPPPPPDAALTAPPTPQTLPSDETSTSSVEGTSGQSPTDQNASVSPVK